VSRNRPLEIRQFHHLVSKITLKARSAATDLRRAASRKDIGEGIESRDDGKGIESRDDGIPRNFR